MGDELLKIGELAKRSGVSVRMLRHYEGLGLLKPSIRTDANYRLYGHEDVACLHSIQAMRNVGLPLKDIKALLGGRHEPLPAIIQRQINALEYQARQANELCDRLKLVQSALSKGSQPNMADWLGMLESMSTYGKYFNASELKTFFESAKQTRDQWAPLIADINAAMRAKVDSSDLRMQTLARRWMDLSVQMAQGDFRLMKKWEQMYFQEPSVRGKDGDKLETVRYINRAIDLRVKALRKYFSQVELERFNYALAGEWHALSKKLRTLSGSGRAASDAKLRRAAGEWEALVFRTANQEEALAKKFERAFARNAVLKAGSVLGPELEDYIRSVQKALNRKKNS